MNNFTDVVHSYGIVNGTKRKKITVMKRNGVKTVLESKMCQYDEIYAKYNAGDLSWVIPQRTELRVNPAGTVSFTTLFSTMYWRLFENGDRISGIDNTRPHITCSSVTELETGYTMIHRHEFIELSYVYKGSFSQIINGVKYEFNEGDIWIMDRNCMHGEYLFGYDGFIVFFEIHEDYFNEAFVKSFDDNAISNYIRETIAARQSRNRFIRFTSGVESDSILHILNGIVETRRAKLPGGDYIIKGLLINLCHLLAKNYTSALMDAERELLGERILFEVENYVREKDGAVTPDELSKHFNFHKTYFNRLTKRKLGKTFLQFVQDVRIERAKYLLVNTPLPAVEICEKVGYNNRSYFYKLFKEQTGALPADYRTLHTK